MKYYIKSKIFQLKEDIWIRNQYNEQVYFVDNKLLVVGRQFNLLKDNEIVYFVKEEVITLTPKYEVYDNDNLVAKVKQKMVHLKQRVDIQSIYGDLVVKGDICKHNYKIYKENEVIATITKKTSITDNYYIDINFEDEALILILTIIIDSIIDKIKH